MRYGIVKKILLEKSVPESIPAFQPENQQEIKKMKGVVSELFSTVLSAALQGMRAEFIHVEADVGNGLPFFHMVGHLASEVKESAERVRTAIKNSGIQIPPRKVVINLSPANVRKRGAAFDLPIAAAVLAANGVICQEIFAEMLVIGELSLDGGIKKVPESFQSFLPRRSLAVPAV